MDQLIPQTPFDWIGLALVVAVLVRIGWAAFIDYCESTPIYDPMVDGPEDDVQRQMLIDTHRVTKS